MSGTALSPWGHVSRHCVYCGKVGPRTMVAGGYAHKRCLPTAPRVGRARKGEPRRSRLEDRHAGAVQKEPTYPYIRIRREPSWVKANAYSVEAMRRGGT